VGFLGRACFRYERGICLRGGEGMYTLLWIASIIIGIAGIIYLVRGAFVPGIVLIVIALLVGPGGVSLVR